MRWVGYGREGQTAAVRASELSVRDNRVDYDRGALGEWYVNDEGGIEQGFTLMEPAASAQSGLVVLALQVDGDLAAGMAEDGSAIDFATPEGSGCCATATCS